MRPAKTPEKWVAPTVSVVAVWETGISGVIVPAASSLEKAMAVAPAGMVACIVTVTGSPRFAPPSSTRYSGVSGVTRSPKSLPVIGACLTSNFVSAASAIQHVETEALRLKRAAAGGDRLVSEGGVAGPRVRWPGDGLGPFKRRDRPPHLGPAEREPNVGAVGPGGGRRAGGRGAGMDDDKRAYSHGYDCAQGQHDGQEARLRDRGPDDMEVIGTPNGLGFGCAGMGKCGCGCGVVVVSGQGRPGGGVPPPVPLNRPPPAAFAPPCGGRAVVQAVRSPRRTP